MSHAFDDPQSPADYSASNSLRKEASPSWVESFFHSFFQEKNIKWMLVVGAAIVFGSSLMLVTKAWSEWSIALKYLTIVGYTGVIFCAAEISRRRLNLPATYHVLQTLTLLLLPVCFLSLTWLSAGTGVQGNMHWLKNIGLLIPAVALLWIAASTILDHWLRGRQTTFLVSFSILCVAGAIPAITSPIIGFGFLTLCWLAFTAGVVKVNRHTFWLAEQHQLPRVFGFLPIAMLGLQFVTLVAIKAAAALPAQWLGFAVVMVSATILMTTRTVADVFRQRTGDLVRPLPWAIAIPLFIGLASSVAGLCLSLVGFSYVGPTTYAVIPTSIVVALLMSLIARDTKHPAFVWASLAVITLAYQCSPTIFADLVQMAKSATADAINQPRVPLSLYGLTYLPLLGALAVANRQFAKRGLSHFSVPIKQFVTAVSAALFFVAVADVVLLKFISPFLVSAANAIMFMAFAAAFRDRRYAIPSATSFVCACATAIPALSQMQYANVPLSWVPAILAGVAVLMTVTSWPDRLLHRIPVPADDRLMTTACGRQRNLIQLTGCVLAVGMGIHWVVSTGLVFSTALTIPSVIQFALLMLALVRYTIGNAHYLPAASVWILAGYASLRWAVGLGFTANELVSLSTYVLIGLSLSSFVILRLLRTRLGVDSIASMRQAIGFDPTTASPTAVSIETKGIVPQIAAFTMPLFDLSVIVLCSLVACVFIPAVIIQHAALFGLHSPTILGFGWSTTAILAWLFVLAAANGNRAFGLVAALLLPLVVSSTLITAGLLSGVVNLLMVWAVVQCGLTLISHQILTRREAVAQTHTMGIQTIMQIGRAWSCSLLAISCLSFAPPMRFIAVITAFSLAISFIGRWDQWKQTNLAILVNINLLLAAAAIGGCRGWLLPGIEGSIDIAAVPYVFLTGCLSALLFERPSRYLKNSLANQWAIVLRFGLVPLALGSLLAERFDPVCLIAMTSGFVALIVAELLQAIKSRNEARVWAACLIGGLLSLFLYQQNFISFGVGISQIVLLTLSIVALSISHLSTRDVRLSAFRRPMLIIGLSLPAIVACLAIIREFAGIYTSLTALNALSLMIAAGIYFHQATTQGRRLLALPAIVIANAGVFLLWRSLSWSSPELYLVPIGVSILGLAEMMKKELPAAAHSPLHYIGLLTVLCSPLPEVIGGSWIHIFALMVLSVGVILASIGLRMRSLMYAGTAFLLTDLVAMVIRSTVNNANLLWICGVVLGIGVITLAAFCENHREKLLARIRILSAELATWN